MRLEEDRKGSRWGFGVQCIGCGGQSSERVDRHQHESSQGLEARFCCIGNQPGNFCLFFSVALDSREHLRGSLPHRCAFER